MKTSRAGSLAVCLALCFAGPSLISCLAQTNFDSAVRSATAELNQHIVWGQSSTNGIKAGIYVDHLSISNENAIQLSKKLNLSNLSLIPAFVGATTNYVFMWFAPKQSWEIDLASSAGEPAPKTTIGKRRKQGMKIGNRGMENAGFSAVRVNSDLPCLPGPEFKLLELFELNQTGDYNLKITFCGMVVTDGQPVPTYFSPISVRLKVTD